VRIGARDGILYAARSKDEEPGKDSTADQVAAILRRIGELRDRKMLGEPPPSKAVELPITNRLPRHQPLF